MRIEILTFSKANNIGAVLQAYALQKYLTQCNNFVKHIDFSYTTENRHFPKKNTLRNKIDNILHLKRYLIDKEKRTKLEKFRNEYLSFTEGAFKNDLPQNVDDCDAYIVGSDQIWNTDLNGCNENFYMQFVVDKKTISYAGSVGRSLTDKDKQYLRRYIKNIDQVSVREQDLNDYLKNVLGVKSEVVVDPVFLLDQKEWESIETKTRLPHKYVFVYLMENNEVIRDIASEIAKELKADIIWLNGGLDTRFIGTEVKAASPTEFLYLINHAECVVTNSFHGAAFATIFNKKMCVVEHSKRNSRLVQLLTLEEMQSKIVPLLNRRGKIDEYIFIGETKKMNEQIINSKKFLIDALC